MQMQEIDSLWCLVNDATGFMVSKGEYLTLGPKTVSVTQSFVKEKFYQSEKDRESLKKNALGVGEYPRYWFKQGIIYF